MRVVEGKDVIMECLQGDMLTPISIFQRLKGEKKFLLESSFKHEASGRYSFIGSNPVIEIKAVGKKTVIISAGKEEICEESALDILKTLTPKWDGDGLFPFVGGAVGFFAFDVIRQFEQIGEPQEDELNLPDVHFMLFEDIIVFDHLEEKIYLVAIPLLESTGRDDLTRRLEERKQEIFTNEESLSLRSAQLTEFVPTISKDEFIYKVKKAKEYIVAGDIFQVVLSQRMKANIAGEPFSFYCNLRIHNPSPYMYYLDFKDYVVLGASPESLIKAKEGKVTTNPIAGTRPRGKVLEEDDRLAEELLMDEKELAEHEMLVDLGRNDLGRVCQFGTVKLKKYKEVERFKYVMHIVSEVSGMLKTELTPLDALISCLPAGTVSGAPKIRALEIINELEDTKRGVYSGAIGYLSANGNMDFALGIRTMIVKGEDAYIQAGAGIVYDSDPEKEYEETLHKLKAFLEVRT